jgi:hypothetical protein
MPIDEKSFAKRYPGRDAARGTRVRLVGGPCNGQVHLMRSLGPFIEVYASTRTHTYRRDPAGDGTRYVYAGGSGR